MSDPYDDRFLVPGLKKALEILQQRSPGCGCCIDCELPAYDALDELETKLKSAEEAEYFWWVAQQARANADEAQVQ